MMTLSINNSKMRRRWARMWRCPHEDIKEALGVNDVEDPSPERWIRLKLMALCWLQRKRWIYGACATVEIETIVLLVVYVDKLLEVHGSLCWLRRKRWIHQRLCYRRRRWNYCSPCRLCWQDVWSSCPTIVCRGRDASWATTTVGCVATTQVSVSRPGWCRWWSFRIAMDLWCGHGRLTVLKRGMKLCMHNSLTLAKLT